MNFGTKLQMLRKQKGLSQEALAQQLNVSRQAVSKWETNEGYPEMDKLISISQLFDVTLDYLVKEEGEDDHSKKEDKYFMNTQKIKEYISFKKKFALKIALSVMCIILSVNMPIYFSNTKQETMGTIAMMIIIAMCVAVLIMTNMSAEAYGRLEKKYIQMSYQDLQDLQTQYMHFKSKFGMSIALGVFMIIASVAACAYIDEYLKNEVLATMVLITTVALSVFIFIVQGIKDSMYHFLSYNQEYIEKQRKEENSIWGITMPLAAMIFLVMGFTQNWWHPAWLVFPITAILTAGIEQMMKKGD